MADDVLAAELLNDLTTSFFAAGSPPTTPGAPTQAEHPLAPQPPVEAAPQDDDGWVDRQLSEPAVEPAAVFAAVNSHLVRCPPTSVCPLRRPHSHTPHRVVV